MKRFFPFILAASLAITGCSKSDGPVDPDKQIEEERTPEQIQIAKYQQILPELKDYSKIILNKGSNEGEIIVGGLSNNKYIYAKFSSTNQLITKMSRVLPENLKGKFKYVNTVMAGENKDLYYLSLSKTDFPTTPEYLRIINVVGDKAIEIGNNIDGIEKLASLKKSFNVITFISGDKFLIYSYDGKLLKAISSFPNEIYSEQYVVINKDKLVTASIGGDGNIYFKNINTESVMGQVTTNWQKHQPGFSWKPKEGEYKTNYLKIFDDIDNVIVEFTGVGKKYSSSGVLMDYTEKGSAKVNKVTGELVK